MSDSSTPRRRLKIDPSDLALEMVSIVVAILLALAVNGWHDAWARHAQEQTALRAIRDELRLNRGDLLEQVALHARVEAAYRALVDDAPKNVLGSEAFYAAFSRTAPHGYNPVDGESTAWDVARTSDVLTDVPLATRITIEEAYAEQQALRDLNVRVIDDLHFKPEGVNPNFFYAAGAMQIDTNDVTYSERRLRAKYDAALASLDTALR